jgi:hypothetical protein
LAALAWLTSSQRIALFWQAADQKLVALASKALTISDIPVMQGA